MADVKKCDQCGIVAPGGIAAPDGLGWYRLGKQDRGKDMDLCSLDCILDYASNEKAKADRFVADFPALSAIADQRVS